MDVFYIGVFLKLEWFYLLEYFKFGKLKTTNLKLQLLIFAF